MRRHLLSLALPLSGLAAAQDPVIVVMETDPVAGVGKLTRIDNLAVDDLGQWFVEGDTDAADTDTDQVLLDPAGLFLREGQPLSAPAGALLDSFDSVTRSSTGAGGFNHFLDGTAGSGDDSGVYLDAALVIQESDLVDSLSVSAGTPYIGFFDVKINADAQLALVASIDDPAIPTSVDRALVVVDTVAGAYSSTDVRHLEGDVLPGQTEAIADFGTNPHATALDDDGRLLYFADLTGDTATDGVVYLDEVELAQEGDASPVAGRSWLSLSSTKLDLHADGGHVYSGTLDGDGASNLLVVRGGAKFVQEGDVLPGTAGFPLTSFGTGPVLIGANGDVVWFGAWADPDTSRDTGLFWNHELLIQEGVTQIGGFGVTALRGIQDGYALSPGGGFLLVEVELAGALDAAVLIQLPIGARYCAPAQVNSSGQPATLTVTGSHIAGGNPLHLRASQLPTNQFGYFLASQTQGFVPNPGGSQGDLCLGGNIIRYVNQVQSSGSAGEFGIDVDTASLPAIIQAGETWNFTTWYRDANPTPTSNFTDAVSVSFD